MGCHGTKPLVQRAGSRGNIEASPFSVATSRGETAIDTTMRALHPNAGVVCSPACFVADSSSRVASRNRASRRASARPVPRRTNLPSRNSIRTLSAGHGVVPSFGGRRMGGTCDFGFGSCAGFGRRASEAKASCRKVRDPRKLEVGNQQRATNTLSAGDRVLLCFGGFGAGGAR